jgi:6-phosphogluconolactonase (cycloisomerase 2 family)
MKNRLYSILVAVVVLLVACGGTTTDTVGGASSCSGAARVPLGNTQYSLVANRNTSSVSVYAIDSNSGVLSEISGSPFPVSGVNSEPLGVTVNPAGTLAFVPNWGNGAVSVFRIDASNGALAEVEGSPFRSAEGTTSAWQVLISSSGKFAYVLNNSTDSIGV